MLAKMLERGQKMNLHRCRAGSEGVLRKQCGGVVFSVSKRINPDKSYIRGAMRVFAKMQ